MKFEVYNDGKLAEHINLKGIYMFGSENIALRGVKAISFNKGVLNCQKKSTDSAGVSLLWNVNGTGQIMLSTTRLPERMKSYILNVELARAKLMEITTKLEDWAFLDNSNSLLDESKDLFIGALENIHNGSICSVLADESLKKSIEFSAKLAEKNAEMFIKLRKRANNFAKHSLGCEIDPQRITDEKYLKRLGEAFGFLTVPIIWKDIEKEKGEYDFELVDKCFFVLANRKVAISAGPLIRFEPECLPKWIIKNAPPFDKIREYGYNFIQEVVGRYTSKVHAWRVISGMNVKNYFAFNFEQVLEMTRAATLAARSVDTRSLKIVEICQPWGEYYSKIADTTPPMVYLDMIMQSGINPDAIGLRLMFGKSEEGMYLRDIMQISSMLDRFAVLTKPLHITSLEIPGMGSGEKEKLGLWHSKWDEEAQSRWLEQFYKVVLGKPFVTTVTYSKFADEEKSELLSGLVNNGFEPKKSFKSIKKFQKLILNK